MTIAFDTLKFADRLAAGGFTDAQAKTAAAALSDAFTETAVNKADLDQAVGRLGGKIEALRTDITHAIEALRTDVTHAMGMLDAKLDRTAERLDAKIDASAARMTVKLGAMLAVAVGIIGVLLKLLH